MCTKIVFLRPTCSKLQNPSKKKGGGGADWKYVCTWVLYTIKGGFGICPFVTPMEPRKEPRPSSLDSSTGEEKIIIIKNFHGGHFLLCDHPRDVRETHSNHNGHHRIVLGIDWRTVHGRYGNNFYWISTEYRAPFVWVLRISSWVRQGALPS